MRTMNWLGSLPIGTIIQFMFKDGDNLRVPFKKATAEKTQSGEWTAKTQCGILKVYPSNEHPENFHELFSADNGDGWWAMLSQSDLDKALGRRPTSAATTEDEVSRRNFDSHMCA